MRELVMKDTPIRADWTRPREINSMVRIIDEVASTPPTIGYSMLYYEREMAGTPLTRSPAIDGIFPTPATIASGEYPLIYTGYAVTRKGGSAWADALAAWLASPEGQSVVEECGYVRAGGN